MLRSAKSLENNLTKGEAMRLFAQQLSAHTLAMIRTSSESGFVIIPVDSTVGPKALGPFTVNIVNQMLPDESSTDHGVL